MRSAKMLAVAVLVVMRICAANEADQSWEWNLPKGFPKPWVPPDNPMSAAKVELGRYLFYDTRLSVNGKSSCATCHKQELAFTDGRPVGIGTTGQLHSRGAMSLVNIAYSGALTWSNPGMRRLEEQALVPMFGEHPVELGLREGDGILTAIREDARYKVMFAQAFHGESEPVSVSNVTKAIASFERSIISGRSPYDRYHYDRDDNAVSDAAKRGEILFFNQHLGCFRCHGGFNFTDATVTESSAERDVSFHNTGLYNLAGALSYPAPNFGIYEFTKVPADVGKFKTPTLRNVALTGPYMHDGSIATLEGVIDHYAAGGRTIASGPNTGVGRDNPNKDERVRGFQITAAEKQDFIAFLNTLTDDAVLHDPRFANPF